MFKCEVYFYDRETRSIVQHEAASPYQGVVIGEKKAKESKGRLSLIGILAPTEGQAYLPCDCPGSEPCPRCEGTGFLLVPPEALRQAVASLLAVGELVGR